MTVGGTGDVLAGVTGALLCRLPPFEAAVAAVYANGLAGEAAAAGRLSGLLASDMLTALPEVLYGR
jgi:NAD(P)H-hydrate epimerase